MLQHKPLAAQPQLVRHHFAVYKLRDLNVSITEVIRRDSSMWSDDMSTHLPLCLLKVSGILYMMD